MTVTYIQIDTWKAMMIDIVKRLAEIDINPLLRLTASNQSGLDFIFESHPKEKWIEIVPGLYMLCSYSNSEKMRYLNELFDIYDIPSDELSVDVEHNMSIKAIAENAT